MHDKSEISRARKERYFDAHSINFIQAITSALAHTPKSNQKTRMRTNIWTSKVQYRSCSLFYSINRNVIFSLVKYRSLEDMN